LFSFLLLLLDVDLKKKDMFCHDSFLGHSQNFFPILQKKKLHDAVLNGTVHLLLPCACKGKEEKDF